jgi:molybdopterin/thiamine biosynthesis adenylyltransferase
VAVSTPSNRSSRIAGRVNLELLVTKLVVVVGVGSVGSQVAEELANYVGRLRLFDGKPLQEHHLPRHALRKAYVDQNKAVSMKHYLSEEIPTLQVEARPWQINSAMPDDVFDVLLHDADLIVAATDNREVQRAIGRRALALDIPAVFPGLYERNGGEVFVQLSPERPCFLCRDHFRPAQQVLRGVAATNPDIVTIIALANRLSLAVLDPGADYRRLLAPERGERWPPQLFVHNDLVLAKHIVPWHQGCPSCAIGPSPLRPDAVQAWQAAQRVRAAEIPEPRPVPHTATPSTTPSHPATQRSSSADPGELITSGLCVFAWWFFLTDGFNGFAVIWNPLAWIPVIGWFFYAFTSH